MEKFIHTWSGECSAWDCDDLGHMNMRHYMTKVHEARQMFIILLGLPHAFSPNANSSVSVSDFHIQYQGEARPGDPLRIKTGLIALNEDDARLCHIMTHADGRIAATIIENISHVALRTGRTFPWPHRVRDKAAEYLTELPDTAQPRNLTTNEKPSAPNMATLEGWGLKPIGKGVFRPQEMGLDNQPTPQAILGRTTETIGHFHDGWPEFLDEAYREGGNSGALLETRVFINSPAHIGTPYAFYSGLQSANTHTRRLIHNMVSPVTGENIASMIAVSCLFSLTTRRLIKPTAEQLAQLEKNAIKDLTP